MSAPVSVNHSVQFGSDRDTYVVKFDDGTQKEYASTLLRGVRWPPGRVTPQMVMEYLTTKCEPLPDEQH